MIKTAAGSSPHIDRFCPALAASSLTVGRPEGEFAYLMDSERAARFAPKRRG